MANEDPMTERQLSYIERLARSAIPDYEELGDLDRLIVPVYGCDVLSLNRGQASMIIDDLKYEIGEDDAIPNYASIFGPRVPR